MRVFKKWTTILLNFKNWSWQNESSSRFQISPDVFLIHSLYSLKSFTIWPKPTIAFDYLLFRRMYLLTRYLLRFFDCLAHPNLSATFATDQKWPLCHLRISYQSLAGGLRSLQKSEFLKLIILIFHVKKLNN